MTFGELFHLAGTNTVFTVFLGERTSEHIDILDSDLGAGTKEVEVLDRLMPKNVLRYIPGKMPCSRIPGQMKYPHMSVVLEAADCFKCSHRRGRSPLDPDLVGCENRTSYANYHKVRSEGCNMFKEATKWELERNSAFDHRRRPEECE